MSDKLTIDELNQIIKIIKNNKDTIFYKQEDVDKKRHDLIEIYKDSPELLMKLLHETIKPYKSYKDIKNVLKLNGFDKKIKDSVLKVLLENLNFN